MLAERFRRGRLYDPQSYSDTYWRASSPPDQAFESYPDIRRLGHHHFPRPGTFGHLLHSPCLTQHKAAGAAIAVSAKPTDNTKKMRGDHVSQALLWMPNHCLVVALQIFIAGLALQLVSFGIYAVCILLFLHRVYKKERRIWTRDSLGSVWSDWRTLACALVFNCICIIVRHSVHFRLSCEADYSCTGALYLPSDRDQRRLQRSNRHERDALLLLRLARFISRSGGLCALLAGSHHPAEANSRPRLLDAARLDEGPGCLDWRVFLSFLLDLR